MDGTVLARDEHAGTTGAWNEKNTYVIQIPEVKAGAAYRLRTSVRSDDGTDSTGSMTLKFKDIARWRRGVYERNMERVSDRAGEYYSRR